MANFKLTKAEITGEPRPVWLIYPPGEHHRPLAIPHGNLAELFRQYVEQGGTLEPTTTEPTQ